MQALKIDRSHIGNQLNGRAIGSIFFARLWSALAHRWLPQPKQAFTVDIGIGIATVFSSHGRDWLLAAPTKPKTTRAPQRRPPAALAASTASTSPSGSAISIVAFAFSRMRLDAFIPAVVSVIVGIHLFPLAKAFPLSDA